MKRYFLPLSFFGFLVVTLFVGFTGISHAQQNELRIMPIQDQPIMYGGGTFGQTHTYSVLFRGNGEAVVSTKIQFTNFDTAEIRTLRYTLPAHVDTKNVLVYQVDSTPQKTRCYYPMDQQEVIEKPQSDILIPITGAPLPTPSSGESGAMPSLIAPCNYEPYYYGNTYQKADYRIEGKTITITLPTAIYTNQTGNFFISFRTMNFVKKNLFGTYMYEFETIKTDDTINSLQVGISAEQDHVIRDNKGQVNYQGTTSYPSLPALSSTATLRNQEIDSFYNTIGQGTIYKYTSSLAPNETYTVKGVYADKVWKLYIKEILVGLLIIEVAGVVMVIAMMKLIRVIRTAQSSAGKGTTFSTMSMQQKNILLTLGGSFAVSLCIVGYTFLFFFFTMFFQSRFSYSEFGSILFILTVLISLSVYAVLFFGFVLFIGLRKGLGWGIAAFIMQVGWLVLFTIITTVVLFAFRQSFYANPVHIMGSGFSAPAVGFEKPL